MNEPIGTVECPHKNCTETCNVYRFRKRAEDDKLTRFGGKLYADCPKHGRIGADAKEATQEYLLCHAKMNGPQKNGSAGETPAPPKKTAASRPSAGKSSAATTLPSRNSGAPATPEPRPWWSPVIS